MSEIVVVNNIGDRSSEESIYLSSELASLIPDLIESVENKSDKKDLAKAMAKLASNEAAIKELRPLWKAIANDRARASREMALLQSTLTRYVTGRDMINNIKAVEARVDKKLARLEKAVAEQRSAAASGVKQKAVDAVEAKLSKAIEARSSMVSNDLTRYVHQVFNAEKFEARVIRAARNSCSCTPKIAALCDMILDMADTVDSL